MSKVKEPSAAKQKAAESLLKAAAEGDLEQLSTLLTVHPRSAVNWEWQPLRMTPVMAAIARGHLSAGAQST